MGFLKKPVDTLRFYKSVPGKVEGRGPSAYRPLRRSGRRFVAREGLQTETPALYFSSPVISRTSDSPYNKLEIQNEEAALRAFDIKGGQFIST